MQNEIAKVNGIIFSDCVEACLDAYLLNKRDVVLISRDFDYFCVAKKIKDELELSGAIVTNIVLDDDFVPDISLSEDLFNFSKNLPLIITVGGSDLVNLTRYFATIHKCEIVAVLTAVNFLSVFWNKAIIPNNNFIKTVPCKKCAITVLDLALMSNFKKHVFADAFCELSSKLVAIIDFAVDSCLSNRETSPRILCVVKILEELCEGVADNDYRLKIINSQLRLGLLFIDSDGLFGAEYSGGVILNAIKEGSIFENSYLLTKPLIKLYEAFLSCDMIKSDCLPDYVSCIEQLSALCKISEFELLNSYLPLDFEKLYENYRRIEKSDIIKLVYRCRQLFDKLDKIYPHVYNARQKRAAFSTDEIKLAIKLSPFLTRGGLMTIINDSGVGECIE